jgi:hypothetical protein
VEDSINQWKERKLAMKSQPASPGKKDADPAILILDLLIHFLRSLKRIEERAGRIKLFKAFLNTRLPKDDEIVVVTIQPRRA